MFFLDLKPSDNNIEIYDVRRLSNLFFRVEAPYTRQEITHVHIAINMDIQKFCTRCLHCVKCAGKHLMKDCARKKNRDTIMFCDLSSLFSIEIR